MAIPPNEAERPTVSAIILSYERSEAVAIVLDRLRDLPVDEIVIFDNAFHRWHGPDDQGS